MTRWGAVARVAVRVLLCAALLPAAYGCRQRAPVAEVPPRERLFVAALSFIGSLDSLYQAEESRLAQLCPLPRQSGDDCLARNVDSRRRRVVTLHALPDETSPAAAFVNAAVRVRPGEFDTLAIALDLEFADEPGDFVPWREDIGDWGYGIHIDGDVRVSGDWVQILGPAMRVAAWVPIEAPDLYVHVDPIDGHILDLQPLQAASPDGTSAAIEAGSYLITRVTDEAVEFRAEIAADFACGEEIEPPRAMPPVLRAAPSEFFNADGTPRFSTKYSRGC